MKHGKILITRCFPYSKASDVVRIDANLVLENTDRSCFEVGSWINVLGYKVSSLVENEDARDKRTAPQAVPQVQAILVFGQGMPRLASEEMRYDSIAKRRHDAMKRLAASRKRYAGRR